MSFFKKYIHRLPILVFFMVMSLFFIFPMQIHQQIISADDLPYHMNRIRELRLNLQNGVINPQLYTYEFNGTGFLLGTFYPQLTLYPYVIFSMLLNNYVNGVYLGMAFYCFLTMLFTYITVNKIWKNNVMSISSAVIYSFSSYHTINAFTRFALGEYIAMSFLPLVLYGFYAIMFGKKKDWPYLGLGLSAVLFSHVLSTFIYMIFLAILFILFIWKVEDKISRILELIKSVILFILSSAIWIVPFIEQELYHKYPQPSPQNLFLNAKNMSELVISAVNNNYIRVAGGGTYSIGIILLIVIMVAMVNIRKLDRTTKIIYVLGLLTFFAASNMFPWNLLMHTPIKVIQFPFRILSISTFLISVVGGQLCYIIMSNITEKKISAFTMLIFLLVIHYTGLYQLYNSPASHNGDEYINNKLYVDGANKKYIWYLDQYNTKKVINNIEDIYLKKARVNGEMKELKIIDSKPNEVVFKDKFLQNNKRVVLPISEYKNLHAFQNDKELEIEESKDGFLEIINSRSGNISIKYIPSVLSRIATMVSIITWVISFIFMIIKVINRSK